MSTTQMLPPAIDEQPRRKFTRGEVERMDELGFFDGQFYELIEGDLIDKMGQGRRHAFSIQLLLIYLVRCFGIDRLGCQLPVEAAPDERENSLPLPDVWVRSKPLNRAEVRHPHGDELVLAIEVADSSVRFDLSTKAALYARAGVPEYWVINLVKRGIIVHRSPEGGRYRDIHIIDHTGTVSPAASPEALIAVGDLIPGE